MALSMPWASRPSTHSYSSPQGRPIPHTSPEEAACGGSCVDVCLSVCVSVDLYVCMWMCSGDWCVRIWEEGQSKPLHTIQTSVLTQTVTDAAWSPLYETVLGAVTGDGKVRRRAWHSHTEGGTGRDTGVGGLEGEGGDRAQGTSILIGLSCVPCLTLCHLMLCYGTL